MGCILSEEEHEDLDDSHFSELDKNKKMQAPNNRITQVKEADLVGGMEKLSINDSAENQGYAYHNDFFHEHRREPGKHTTTTTIKNEDSNVRLPPVAGSVASFNISKYFDKNRQKVTTLEDQYINDSGSDRHVNTVLRVDELKGRKVIISWPSFESVELVDCLRLKRKGHYRKYELRRIDTSIEIQGLLTNESYIFQLFAVDKKNNEILLLSSEEFRVAEKPKKPEGLLKVEELPNSSALVSWTTYNNKHNKVKLILRKTFYQNYTFTNVDYDVDVAINQYKFDGLSLGIPYWFCLTAVNQLDEKSMPLQTQNAFKLTDAPACPNGPLDVEFLSNYNVKVSWPRYTRDKVSHLYFRTVNTSNSSVDELKLSVHDKSCKINTLSFDEKYSFELIAVNTFGTESKPLQTKEFIELPGPQVSPDGPLEFFLYERSRSVTIKWPSVKQSKHLKYLRIYKSNSKSSTMEYICTLSPYETIYTVKNLDVKRDYFFHLVTVNTLGKESPPLTAGTHFTLTDVTPSPIGPLQVLEIDDDLISVQWKQPECNQNNLNCYKVYASDANSRLSEVGKAISTVTECVLEKKRLPKKCRISVVCENKKGDKSQPLEQEKPPKTKGPVKKYAMTPNSISLSWTKPEENGCQLKYFVIEYEEHDKIVEEKIPYSDKCKATIKNLKGNQQYKFNIMTENIFGERSEGIKSPNMKPGQIVELKENNTTTRIDKTGEEYRRQRTCDNSTCHRKCETTKESNFVDKSKRNIETAASNKSDVQEKKNEFKTEEETSKPKDTQYSYKNKRMIQGIPNIGFTCYANSILQVLGQTPGFVEKLESYVLNLKENEKCNTMAFMLFGILNSINTSAGFSVSDELVRRLMFKIFSVDKSFERYTQNDCHSFLMCLFNGIKEENNYKETGCNAPIEMFEGEMKNGFKYSTCDHTEFSEAQSFSSLLVPIPNHQNDARKQSASWTVEKGLALLLEKEDFENNILPCTVCEDEKRTPDDETVTTKTTEITQAPRTLILQIGRFREHASEYYPHKSTLRKVHSAVGYNKELKVPVKVGEKTVKKTYILYAVVLHFGTLNGGHYYSYVKANNSTTKWFYCSDSSVFEVQESDIHRESDQAYLLCYHLNEK